MTDHSQRAHSKLAPSSAARWLACPGSVRLSASIEETSSVFAAEGTAAHELAEYCLQKNLDAAAFKGFIVAPGGLHAPEPDVGPPDEKTCFRVTPDMIDAVQLYLNTVREIRAQSTEFATEVRMDMTAIVPGVFGTGDFIAYRERPTRRVTVVDYKHGKGIPVEVEENEQALTYAMGVVQRYHNRGVDEVEIVIVQPRAPHRDGPVRRWVADVTELYEHVMALQDAAKLAVRPDAPFKTGEHCRFCKAAGVCAALKTRVEEIVKQDPATTPYGDWAIEAANIELVKGWARRREEFAHSEAIRGRLPPGAKLVGKRSNRKWKDERDAIATLQLLGVSDDDIWSTSLNSPAAVEKALPVADRKVVATLSFKPPSGTVLAPLSDPRPAVDATDAGGFDDHSGGDE